MRKKSRRPWWTCRRREHPPPHLQEREPPPYCYSPCRAKANSHEYGGCAKITRPLPPCCHRGHNSPSACFLRTTLCGKTSPGGKTAAAESTCRCRQQTPLLHLPWRGASLRCYRLCHVKANSRECGGCMSEGRSHPSRPWRHREQNSFSLPPPSLQRLAPCGMDPRACRCRRQAPLLHTSWSAELRRVATAHATQRPTRTSTVAVCPDTEVARSWPWPHRGGKTTSVCPLLRGLCLVEKPLLDPRAGDSPEKKPSPPPCRGAIVHAMERSTRTLARVRWLCVSMQKSLFLPYAPVTTGGKKLLPCSLQHLLPCDRILVR